MKITIDNASKVLANPDEVTSETATVYRNLLDKECVRLEELLHAIKDPAESGRDRWHSTAATGSDSDLKALEDEYDALERDLKRRQAQHDQFRELERISRQREATAELPGWLNELDAKADAVSEARWALEVAFVDLQHAFDSTRRAYSDGQTDKPRPSEALVEKVIQTAENAEYTPQGHLHALAKQRPHRIAEQLRYAESQGMADIVRPWKQMAKPSEAS